MIRIGRTDFEGTMLEEIDSETRVTTSARMLLEGLGKHVIKADKLSAA